MATNPRFWKSLKAVQSKLLNVPHLKEWVFGITDGKKTHPKWGYSILLDKPLHKLRDELRFINRRRLFTKGMCFSVLIQAMNHFYIMKLLLQQPFELTLLHRYWKDLV